MCWNMWLDKMHLSPSETYWRLHSETEAEVSPQYQKNFPFSLHLKHLFRQHILIILHLPFKSGNLQHRHFSLLRVLALLGLWLPIRDLRVTCPSKIFTLCLLQGASPVSIPFKIFVRPCPGVLRMDIHAERVLVSYLGLGSQILPTSVFGIVFSRLTSFFPFFQ